MSKLIGALCASVVTISGAAAQDGNVVNPTSIIANFDIQSVGPVLNELGVTWQAQKAENGQTYIVANVAGQVNFLLAPTACRAAGNADCIGLSMVAIFEGQANPQTVKAFNYRYAFASAGVDPSGSAYLSRYEISDYGMPRGNLATSIKVFANQVMRFGSELDTARRTVSLEGFADDMAASQLNRQGRGDLSGAEIHAVNSIDLHQQGLEQSATYVRQFIADESAPRNKINNNIGK